MYAPPASHHNHYCSAGGAALGATANNDDDDDARGAACRLDHVTLYRGPHPVVSSIDWRIEPQEKWALVGENGAGKSTLLRAIVGKEQDEQFEDDDVVTLTEGSIAIGSTQTVGYLRQTAVSGSNRTVYEEAASAMADITSARRELEQATQRVQEEDASEANVAALDRATERFHNVGGYTQEQQVAVVLRGLGFTDFHQQTCDRLSGGWQMRVSLAKLLLSKPSLLLLDEPSNHLDVSARRWLANYLQSYDSGAMILVTHDASLLQHCTQHIAEIVPGGRSLQIYKSCSYDQYLQERERRSRAARAQHERHRAKAAKLQGFVDRVGASATRASAAQSRVKQLERMQRQGLLGEEEEPSARDVRFLPKLTLPDPPKAIGETLLELMDAQVGWTPERPLVSHVNLRITKGMKLWIRAPNGAGKSTVLAGLRGKLALSHGERVCNHGLRLGVFTQDLAQELDANARAVDLVTAYARSGNGGDIRVSDQEARNVMGRLGLGGDKPLRRVGDLSGGEKARVALAMFCLKPSNVLLLDEPSNHLDSECVKALSEALSSWGTEQGAVVVVSHDRGFCQSVGFTHVGSIVNGEFRLEERSMRDSDWDEGEGLSAMGAGIVTNGSATTATARSPSVDRTMQKQAYNAPKRIAKLESLVEKAEVKLAGIEQEMMEHGSDLGRLMELTEAKEAVEGEIAAYMEEWESLETLLATVAAQ